MSGELILLVDDEPSILSLARMYLERENFRIEEVKDGESALQKVKQVKPALMVLDLMLPKVDGFEICRRLRSENNPIPILILTARDDDIDKIIGLELGADDYLTKPFNPRELVARIKAILRRSGRPSIASEEILFVGDLEVDPVQREVRIKGGKVELRTQEFEVLLVLASQPGRVFKREQLLQQAWGFDFYGQTRTVDVHIATLRKKLVDSSIRIDTVTGIGYKLTS